MTKHIKIYSKNEIREEFYGKIGENDYFISIDGPGTGLDYPNIDPCPNRVCRLKFDDLQIEELENPFDYAHCKRRGLIFPNIKEIDKALNFYKNLSSDCNLYIHCFAGISRSSAITFLCLIEYYQGDVEKAAEHLFIIKKDIRPNNLILREGLNTEMFKRAMRALKFYSAKYV